MPRDRETGLKERRDRERERENWVLLCSSHYDPNASHSIKQRVGGRANGLRVANVGPLCPAERKKERERERERERAWVRGRAEGLRVAAATPKPCRKKERKRERERERESVLLVQVPGPRKL